MNFAEALEAAKTGKRVARPAWKDNAAYMRAQAQELFWGSKDHPEQHYHAIHSDIFAEDWLVLESPPA